MDDAQARATLVTVCAGLSRLQLRLRHVPRAAYAAGRADDRRLRELQPPSPWLDARDPKASLSATIDAVAVAIAYLLAMVDAPAPIDAQLACLAMQHIQGEFAPRWGTMTLRLAQRLEYNLADTPLDEFHGAYLTQHQLPRAKRAQRAPV